jgi:hypothetical protein
MAAVEHVVRDLTPSLSALQRGGVMGFLKKQGVSWMDYDVSDQRMCEGIWSDKHLIEEVPSNREHGRVEE